MVVGLSRHHRHNRGGNPVDDFVKARSAIRRGQREIFVELLKENHFVLEGVRGSVVNHHISPWHPDLDFLLDEEREHPGFPGNLEERLRKRVMKIEKRLAKKMEREAKRLFKERCKEARREQDG